MPEYHRWTLNKEDLVGLTPLRARDIIVQCFFEAQKETLARTSDTMDVAAIKQQAVGLVKGTMESIKEDFDSPTRQSLVKLLDELGTKAYSWGTPADIIMHHMRQMQDVLKALK